MHLPEDRAPTYEEARRAANILRAAHEAIRCFDVRTIIIEGHQDPRVDVARLKATGVKQRAFRERLVARGISGFQQPTFMAANDAACGVGPDAVVAKYAGKGPSITLLGYGWHERARVVETAESYGERSQLLDRRDALITAISTNDLARTVFAHSGCACISSGADERLLSWVAHAAPEELTIVADAIRGTTGKLAGTFANLHARVVDAVRESEANVLVFFGASHVYDMRDRLQADGDVVLLDESGYPGPKRPQDETDSIEQLLSIVGLLPPSPAPSP